MENYWKVLKEIADARTVVDIEPAYLSSKSGEEIRKSLI